MDHDCQVPDEFNLGRQLLQLQHLLVVEQLRVQHAHCKCVSGMSVILGHNIDNRIKPFLS